MRICCGCVEGGDEKLFVGGIYIVPTSSSRARKAEELIQELAEDIARYQQEGTVMVGGDWNCKIGEIQSEAGDRIYERQSVSKNSRSERQEDDGDHERKQYGGVKWYWGQES